MENRRLHIFPKKRSANINIDLDVSGVLIADVSSNLKPLKRSTWDKTNIATVVQRLSQVFRFDDKLLIHFPGLSTTK